jgi:hypothetical protein
VAAEAVDQVVQSIVILMETKLLVVLELGDKQTAVTVDLLALLQVEAEASLTTVAEAGQVNHLLMVA